MSAAASVNHTRVCRSAIGWILATWVCFSATVLAEDDLPDVCEPAIRKLVAELKSDNHLQRWDALFKLALYRAQAADAVPELSAHLSNKTDRRRTVFVLSQIGTPARNSVPELARLLDELLAGGTLQPDDLSLAVEMVRALGEIREPARVMMPVLKRALKSAHADIRYEAAHALGELGRAARPALPELRKLCRDSAPLSRTGLGYGSTVGESAAAAVEKISSSRR